MKKLLELLGIVLITSNAAGPLVANKPNNNKIKNSLETLTRSKRQAPKKKGQDNKIKPQNKQSSSKTDNRVEFIEREVTLDENYSENIQKMVQELIKEKHLNPLRTINMGGLISNELDNKTIISKLEELEPKMVDWIKEQKNNKEKVLILTLKNSNNQSIKLVINLSNFYIQGFINKDEHVKKQYFYFKDSQVQEIKDKDLNIQESINLGYDSNYSHLITESDFKISYHNINDSIITLSKHTEEKKQKNKDIKGGIKKLKSALVRLIFITSEAMRFQCDEESLKIYANIKNIDELKNNLQNILAKIQEKVFKDKDEINWSDYKEQINNWSKYSEKINEFRIEIWKELIKMKKLNDFICQNKNKIIEIFQKENKEEKILNEIRELFNKEENEKFKELKDNNFLKQFTKIKFREMQMKLVKFFKDSTNDLANKFKDLNISEENQELTHFRIKFNEIKNEEINLNLNFENNGVFLFAVIQNNLDFLKFLLNSGIKIEIKNIEWLAKWTPLHFATQNGNLEIVKMLINKAEELYKDTPEEFKKFINAIDVDNFTPLHIAAAQKQNGNLEIVKMLINKAEELYKDTPEEFKKFINAQTSEDTDKVTPLHIAVKDGSLTIVELLLQQGAEVDAKNQDDATPLHLAAKKKCKKIVELLIKNAKELYKNKPEKFKNFINAQKSNNGKPPLHFAIEEQEDDIVKLLIDNGADINSGKSNNGKTPLHFAAEYSFTNKVIKLLIENAKELYKNKPEKFKNFINAQTSNKKKTALHYAVQYGHTDIVQELLNQENIEIDVKNEVEGTPLHIAAQNGHLAIVKMLINKAEELYKDTPEEFKKFINAQKSNNGKTPLDLAKEKNHTETIDLLKKYKANSGNNGSVGEQAGIIDAQNQNTKRTNQEETPSPSKRPKLNDNEAKSKTAEEKNGLYINKIKNQDEVTALHMAVKDDNEELVEFLINELGADVNARKSNNGKTPLHFATEERKDDIVKLLIDKGADVNARKSNNGKTPLHFAAQYSYTNEVVKLLLDNGAAVEIKHKDKWTALHYAVQYGHTDIVQELLTNENSENKININFKNKKGNTALHIAAQNGHLAIVKMLINKAEELYKDTPEEFKKFINASDKDDKDGRTPLDLAKEKNHTETIDLLKKYKAKNLDNDDTTMEWQRGGGRIVGINKQAVTSGTQNKNTKTTNKNNLYDVPADGSCLFWSVATSYLVPVRNNNEEFRNRFIQLFGELQLSYLSYIQTLLQQFDLSNTNNFLQAWYQDATAHRLVRVVFRNRVADYIERNLDNSTQRNTNRDGELTFRSLIQENNEIASNYLERMRQSPTWGGTPEILAMSNLINTNIGVGTDSPYQPVHQNANNNIAISYVELEEGSGVHNHYNFVLTSEEDRTNHPITINDNQGNVPIVDITKRPDNLPPTTPQPEVKPIKLPVDDHGQHHTILAKNNEEDDANQGNNIIKAPAATTTPLQKDEYHFFDKKTEDDSLKNDENLEINLIKNNKDEIKQNAPAGNQPINTNMENLQTTTTKAINQYNALSKEEKLKKLNKINRYYQTLSENDKKTFKEKLTNTGLAALSGGALTAYGTKMTVSSTAATSVTNAEAMEMTPLLSTSTTESLAAAETITVAETAAVEGGVIAGETGTAAALAPETLGLSLVIGGLAIAGTWMYFAFHHHATSDIALPASIHHNVYDNIEKWYKFLAHDKLKIKINKNTWNEIKQNKNSPANIIKIIKNKFVINDHSGWGGSVTNEDFNTFVKVIVLHFEQINGYFEILDNENDGFVIITNTEGDWLGIE